MSHQTAPPPTTVMMNERVYLQVVCVSVAGKVSGADLATTPGHPAVDRLAMKWAAPLADVEVVEGNS